MSLSLRRYAGVVLAFAAVSAELFVACGIEDNGLLTDASGIDVNSDGSNDANAPDVPDIGIPPTCKTIDASCLPLDADVPDGWSLVGLANDPSTACPFPDFNPLSGLITNAQVAGGSCTCAGCTTSGSYTCNGTARVSEGTTCTDFDAAVAPNGCAVNSETGAHTNASVVPPAPVGSIGCSNPSSGGVVTDEAGVCVPNKCQADYCGLQAQGFRTCIITQGQVSCPNGFTTVLVGTTATYSCGTCPCTIVPAQCSGSIQVFSSTDCGNDAGMDASYLATIDSGAGCAPVGSNYASALYLADPPPSPACGQPSPGSIGGNASLLGVKTVCCSN